jgi:hypothetical protein
MYLTIEGKIEAIKKKQENYSKKTFSYLKGQADLDNQPLDNWSYTVY